MKRFFLLALAALFTSASMAEGYQVNTLSAKQLGMGHTGVSQKLDSESLWFNPAAASHQDQKFTIAAGVTGIMATAEWEEVGNYTSTPDSFTSNNDWSTPLYFSANYKLNDNLAVGLSFNTPFGSSMNWSDNWAGAHVIQNIQLSSYTAQPTISYKFLNDKLSVGVGLMMSWGTFELSRSMFEVGATSNATVSQLVVASALTQMGIDPTTATADQIAAAAAATAPITDVINGVGNNPLVSATLGGDAGVKVGVNIGLMYDINEQWSVGASYRSRVNMEVGSGHAALSYANETVKSVLNSKFAGMESGAFSAELPLPSTLSVGASFRPSDKWEFAAEFQWVGWSAYDNLVVTFNDENLSGYNQDAVKNYSNTMISRVGAQYAANDWLTVRTGFYVDESPVASAYLNPETPSMTKVGYTAGASLRPCVEGNFVVDLSYGYISSADPERMGSYPTVNNLTGEAGTFSGNYTTRAHTVAVGLRWGF